MIYITGDCHAEFNRFNTRNFPEQAEMTRDDFVLICGDFGGVWKDGKEERYWLDWLEKKPFTLLFVCGNHENFDRLDSEFPVVDFHGGRAHRIRENIYHLMRGNIFDLCGRKIFTFGGASSHDIRDGILDPADFKDERALNKKWNEWGREGRRFRVKGRTWWSQEMPSLEEMEFGRKTLAANGNEVDFIVSHCCPEKIVDTFARGMFRPDSLTLYFDEIMETVKFKKWFFGHYHDDRQITEKFVLLYEQIIRIA